MTSNPKVTEIADGASAARLILRITALDPNGEQATGPTTEQVVVEGIDGSPEGRAVGSPGDMRIRQDVPQLWQKITGIRTTTGWQLVTGGGGGGLCDSLPQPIVAGDTGSPGIDGDASRCDHQHVVPVAAPVSISPNANAVGSQPTLVRSDHTHQLTLGAAAAGDVAVFDGTDWIATPRSVVEQGVLVQGINILATSGTVDDQVARFTGFSTPTAVGLVPLASWITIADSVTLGTTFQITQAGLYACLFSVPLNGGQTLQVGWTLDAPVAVRQNAFNTTMLSVYDNNFVFGSVVESRNGFAMIVIDQARIDAGGGVLRAQWGDVSGGATPGGAIAIPADCNVRIFRDGNAS